MAYEIRWGIMNPIRIVLADDHAVVRQGLRMLLEQVDDFTVVGEAKDGREVVDLVGELDADVAVMDFAMPSMRGVEATQKICQLHPKVKVLMLSMYSNQEYVHQSMEAGAAGYIVKDVASDELVQGIRAVAQGKTYFSSGMSENFSDGSRGKRQGLLSSVTAREREVLQLIAEGNSNKQIASLLSLSVKTVEAHRSNLMAKLDIHDTATLTRFAVASGVVPPT